MFGISPRCVFQWSAQASMTLRARYGSGFGVVPALEAVTLFHGPCCLFHISEKYTTGKQEKVPPYVKNAVLYLNVCKHSA